jgi:hypothetical protein
MSLSFNPVDLFNVWRESRKEQDDSFIEWIEAVQRELKKFLAVWVEIKNELELERRAGTKPFERWSPQKWREISSMFNQQSITATYMSKFYECASAATGNRNRNVAIIHGLAAQLSTVLAHRERAREVAEWYVEFWGQKTYFYANDESNGKWSQSVGDAIDSLTREIVALDVLTETVKANPNMFGISTHSG